MLGAVNGHILHQRTKFHKDRSNRCGDIAIFVIFFQDAGRRHVGFSSMRYFYGRSPRGATYVTVPNFIKIGQTVAEIWRFNGFFQNGGGPPSWICRVRIGTTHEDY